MSRELLICLHRPTYQYHPSENLNPLREFNHAAASTTWDRSPFDIAIHNRRSARLFFSSWKLPATLNNLTPGSARRERSAGYLREFRNASLMIIASLASRGSIANRARSRYREITTSYFSFVIRTVINMHNGCCESVGYFSKCRDPPSISRLPWRGKLKRERSAGYL